MKEKNKGILMIVPTFSPNVGGVETHMDDLVKKLTQSGYHVFIHTYSPITTPGVPWQAREEYPNVSIWRYAWFGKNLLHKIERLPMLDFLYLTPYLFLRTFIFMLFSRGKIDIIHAQGLNAAFIGKYLKWIFKKRLIVSTHALYDIAPKSQTARRIKNILDACDVILTLGKASFCELSSFGIDENKMDIYRYWIDLNIFQPASFSSSQVRQKLLLEDKFSILFVGRLTEIKGVKELVRVACLLPEINFIFIGTGPLAEYLNDAQTKNPNIKFLGRIDNTRLGVYYNACDLLCIPSQYKEGLARVVVEAVASGVSVVGSNMGVLPEALDGSVSLLVPPSIDNLKTAILRLYKDPVEYKRLKSNCRDYALKNFSELNAQVILKAYEKKIEREDM